ALRAFEHAGDFFAVLLQRQRNSARAGRRLNGEVPVAGHGGLRERGGSEQQCRQNETRTSHESRLLKEGKRADRTATNGRCYYGPPSRAERFGEPRRRLR